jgi:hypothetical protein
MEANQFSFLDAISVLLTIITAAWAWLMTRFFKLIDDERDYVKKQFDKVNNELDEIKDDISQIKVMVGKLEVQQEIKRSYK